MRLRHHQGHHKGHQAQGEHLEGGGRGLVLQGRALDGDQRVDGHRLGVLRQRGQLVQEPYAVQVALAHAYDATGAHADARAAHRRQRVQPVLPGAGLKTSVTLCYTVLASAQAPASECQSRPGMGYPKAGVLIAAWQSIDPSIACRDRGAAARQG